MKKDNDSSSQTKTGQPAAMLNSEPPLAMPRQQETLAAQSKPLAVSLSQTSPSVELRLEEIVLHGFPAVNRYRIGEALERELTRLLTGQGAPLGVTQGVELERLDLGAFELRPDADAETIGRQLAEAIYGGLSL